MKRFLQLALCVIGLPLLAAGLNNGASWEDAWTNFASVTWTRGDTYYLAGGDYNEDVSISVALSGSTWVVLKKANAADNSGDAWWQPSFATDQAVINGKLSLYSGYIEVDGVTGSGTSGHGIKVYQSDAALNAVFISYSISHFNVFHLEASGPGFGSSVYAADGIYQNSTAATVHGFHYHGCWVHDVVRNGLCLGNVLGTSFSDYGVLVDECVISETGGCLNPALHGQGIQFSNSKDNGYVIVRNSVFRNIEGTGMIVGLGDSTHHEWLIYDNLFYITDNATYNVLSPGVITTLDASLRATNIQIFNNTFYNIATPNLAEIRLWDALEGSGTGVRTNGCSIVNNLFEDCNFTAVHSGLATNAYNGYYNNSGAGNAGNILGQVVGASTAFVDGPNWDFRLAAGTYPVDEGLDLSGYFTTDFAGVTRFTPWDIGAYMSENLIGWWKLDDGSGLTATDSAGSNDGTLSGGPAWTAGRVGTYALTFDGEDSLVTIPYDSIWNFAGDFTVTAWVNSDTNSRLSAIGRWNSDLWNGWTLEQIDQTRFDFEYQDRTVIGEGSHRSVGSGLGYLTNEWHFVCGVLSNDIVRVYVDGNVGTVSNPITNSIALTTEGIAIGARKVSTPDAHWRGAVDDVRIYNRMLTGAEITALYNGTGDVTAPTPDPLTWSSVPAAVNSSSITMVASTATDETSTVSYYFDETSGNPGGSDSGWQASATYTDSGLNAATQYTYRVKARDEAMNETGYSSAENATTSSAPAGTITMQTGTARVREIRRP